MFTKWLKNLRWMNTHVGKGFFDEKMANLKVLLRKFAKHIVDSTSFMKTVKFSIEICSKMILIGNVLEVLMKNLTCVWRNIYNTARAMHSRYHKHFAKHVCNQWRSKLDNWGGPYSYIRVHRP